MFTNFQSIIVFFVIMHMIIYLLFACMKYGNDTMELYSTIIVLWYYKKIK